MQEVSDIFMKGPISRGLQDIPTSDWWHLVHPQTQNCPPGLKARKLTH